jgi:ribonuclease HII
MTNDSIGSDLETSLARAGYLRLIGVDEAGRGPVAGPVVAAAATFAPGTRIPGVTDSKALSASQRAALEGEIRSQALGLGLASVSAACIDRINIREATKLAMRVAIRNCVASLRAAGTPVASEASVRHQGQRNGPRKSASLTLLPKLPDLIIIDGDFVPVAGVGIPEQCFVKGDARAFHIAAASIIAKEWRDRLMKRLALRSPGYGFEKH